MQSVGLGMVKAKRLNPMELFGGHGVKDKKGIHAMLKKAREIEDQAAKNCALRRYNHGKKEYAFYPGCSSQKGASASNYLTSVESMCKTLDIKLNEIPDWNCCGASIGYAEGGELPRHRAERAQHRAVRTA